MAEPKVGGDVVAIFGLAMFLTIGTTLINDGTLGWLIAFPVLAMFIYCMCRAPLRYSLYVVAFLAFTLESPNDVPASGEWKSPLFPLGALFLMHLNNSLGPRWMGFSGIDIFLGTLCLVALYRKYSGASIDRIGRIETPKPLITLAFVSLGGTLFTWLSGIARGGTVSWSLWQVEKVVYLPVIFLLCHVALRGPKDHSALAKVLIGAALVKACVALYVVNTVELAPDQWGNPSKLAWATTHHDSMLFAGAFVLIIALALERGSKSARRLAYWALPLLVAGMIANNRRLVWVEVAIVFVTTYFVTPPSPTKRLLKRMVVLASPLIVVYLAVGWESTAPAFKPVQMLRSVTEPATDSSSLWREIENYNLVYTLRQHWILGTGYGHPFWEVIALPAIAYPLEHYCPHNSLVGLWAYSGYIGYTSMTLLWVVGVYFGIRAYDASKIASYRAAAMTSYGSVCIYLVHCFGDIGLGMWAGVWTVAPALVVAGKLAVVTGEWGAKKASEAPVVVAASVAAQPATERALGPAGAQGTS